MIFCFYFIVGWFELIAIAILCSSYKAFVMCKVFKFSISMSHVHLCLYYSCVKKEHDTQSIVAPTRITLNC